ncbi:uncharacterized protein LOC117108751 [Anneissia japonica]|uniref:uncharacterized protein LOC117108751 n=1 Tax=Anneissia japonica TaxID=1529436 RepID=UPI0014254DEC|nr:uncharacterized protein LOC117108751 [Anneissia japonica]
MQSYILTLVVISTIFLRFVNSPEPEACLPLSYSSDELLRLRPGAAGIPPSDDVKNLCISQGCWRKTHRGRRAGKRVHKHSNRCAGAKTRNSLSVCLMNARSIRNKAGEISDFVEEHRSNEPFLNTLKSKTTYTIEMFEENLRQRPVVETSNSFRVFARAQWPWMSALCYHPNVHSLEGTEEGLEALRAVAKQQDVDLTTNAKERIETRNKRHTENVMRRDVLQGQNSALGAVLELMDFIMLKKKSEIEQKNKRLVAITGEIILTAGKRENARFVSRNFKEQLKSLRQHLSDKEQEHQKEMEMLDKEIVDLESELERA